MKQAYASLAKQVYHLIGRLKFKKWAKIGYHGQIIICNPSTTSFDFTI